MRKLLTLFLLLLLVIPCMGARKVGFPYGRSAVPIDQSCVGYWKLDDASGQTNIKDYTSSGNDGTSANNKVDADDPWGVSGGAMSFDGSSDYVSFTPIQLSTIHSLSLWKKSSGTDGVIVGGNQSPSQSYMFYEGPSGGGKMYYQVQGVRVSAARAATTGTWEHVAVVRSGTSVSFYSNGQLVSSETLASNPMLTVSRISGFAGTGNFKFTGSISDVRIYNRALSSREVKALYMAGR